MNQFWNERYSADEYAYGTNPNAFIKEQLQLLNPAKILFPAEGEGRNAVYAAEQGWEVHAFDSSSKAARKAHQLAKIKQVEVNYLISGFNELPYRENEFDCIASIYFHPAASERSHFHKNMLRLLKPGGVFLLEGFAKNQMNYNSGGPRNAEVLFSRKDLQEDFSLTSNLRISESEVKLSEGIYHQGTASVIRLIAVK